MIDREARTQMASAVRSYMAEEITAVQLDDFLARASESTEDETIKDTRWAIWYHYDDCKDHKIVALKQQWDYFNRILLLLESDCEIEVDKRRRRWHPHQAIAAICLVAFGGLIGQTGFGSHLFILAIPFGLVSMSLAWWSSHGDRRRGAGQDRTTPFPSTASLLAARRRVPGFRQCPYPHSITHREIRGGLSEFGTRLPWYGAWLMFAPVSLFLQMLPRGESETIVRMPDKPVEHKPNCPVEKSA